MEYLPPDEYVLYETLDPLTPRHLLLAAQAVERFHAVGYRHGDLHFKNILWSVKTQSVKIIDLETARPDDDPCHTDSRDDGRCDDAISVTAWDLKADSAGQFWDSVAAFLMMARRSESSTMNKRHGTPRVHETAAPTKFS